MTDEEKAVQAKVDLMSKVFMGRLPVRYEKMNEALALCRADPGVDANWLLNSLVVVIIGGMGSLGGAAIGALLLGLVTNFAAAYLPADYTFYSIIFTFVLLALVLAVRPLGLYGRPA